MKRLVQRALAVVGLKLVRLKDGLATELPSELTDEDRDVLAYVRNNELSMVSDERLLATAMACAHVARAQIPGDFVECGVYRGGNALIAADVFRRLAPMRGVWLYDTFTGMTAPSSKDVSVIGVSASTKFERSKKDDHIDWCYAPLEQVKSVFANRGLLTPQVQFVVGDVCETLVRHPLPERISVLRLDTDFYDSTKKELEVLYPRLSPGGVLIVDDYGAWQGSKLAVDEYFADRPRPFLQYCDFSRVGVKCE